MHTHQLSRLFPQLGAVPAPGNLEFLHEASEFQGCVYMTTHGPAQNPQDRHVNLLAAPEKDIFYVHRIEFIIALNLPRYLMVSRPDEQWEVRKYARMPELGQVG